MSVNVRQTAFALGKVKQADLATANLEAALFRPSKINRTMADIRPITESNAQDLGKDDEFATQVFPLNWDGSFQLETYTSSEMAAFAFAFGLGNSTDSAPATGAYRHTAVPQSADINLLPFTYVEKLPSDGSVHDLALVGCVVNGWELQLNSGLGRQASKLIIDCVASGKITRPSALTLPAASTLHGLNAGSATITILGNALHTSGKIVQLSCGWRNNLRADGGFYPGSGVVDGFQSRGRMEHGDREASLSFTVRAETDSDQLDDLVDQAEGTAVITLQGDLITGSTYHDLSITFHRIVLKSVVMGDTDGLATYACEAEVLKHNSNGVITAYATNEIALFGGETA